jgi:hypothetical protein
MAAIPLLLVQGRNCYIEYAGNPALNCHLALGKAKLPVNKESYEDFQPGAVNGSIEMATGAEACMLGFDLKGVQPDVLPLTQLPRGDRLKITVYAALVNEYAEIAADREVQVVATAYGRLNAELGELEANMGTDYELRSISKYSLVIRTNEVCRWNVQQGGWQDVGGQRARINQMIGVVG